MKHDGPEGRVGALVSGLAMACMLNLSCAKSFEPEARRTRHEQESGNRDASVRSERDASVGNTSPTGTSADGGALSEEERAALREARLRELAEAEALWLAQGITDYEWHIENSCSNCTRVPGYNARVVVRDNAVVSILSGEYLGEPDTEYPLTEALSWHNVEGFFERLRTRVNADPDTFEITYGAVPGLPRNVWVDPRPNWYDEEDNYWVRDFQKLTPRGDAG